MLTLATHPATGRGLYVTNAVRAGTDVHTSPAPLAHAFTSPLACGSCGAPPPAPPAQHPACQGCLHLRFCSRACQARDWPAHRLECSAFRQAAQRGAAAALSPAVRLVHRMLRAAGAAAAAAAEGAPPSDGPLSDPARLAALEAAPSGLRHQASNYALHTERDLAAYAALCPALVLLQAQAQRQCSPREVLAMCARARCSAFTVCDSELRPLGLALFGVGGAANHSCAPTALAHFDASAGGGLQQRLRVTSALASGAELTIAYCEVGAPTHARRAELQRGYFFQCGCARCAAAAAVEAQLLLAPAGSGLTALPRVPLAGGAPAASGAAAAAAEELGEGPLPYWRYLEAHSPQDVAMLSVPCSTLCATAAAAAAAGSPQPTCPGALLCVPAVGVGEQGDPGSDGGLFALPCAACGAAPQPEPAQRLAALFACVEGLRGGGGGAGGGVRGAALVSSPGAAGAGAGATPPRERLAACLAALAQAQALRLPPTHYLLFTSAAAAAHAAVDAEAWGAGLEAGALAVPGMEAAYPPGHPAPPLHAALLGKLAHFLEQSAMAALHFERALQGLQRTHGKEHPLVLDIAGRMAEACDEASARV